MDTGLSIVVHYSDPELFWNLLPMSTLEITSQLRQKMAFSIGADS